MRDFDENNITEAVIDRFKNTPDPHEPLRTKLVKLARQKPRFGYRRLLDKL